MKKKLFALAATAGIVAGSSLIWAAPASADIVSRCVGEAGAVTVPGDLVIPAGKACTLTGTTIQGDVRVARGADLVATDITVEGDVIGQENSYAELTDSEVTGQLNLRTAFGTYLDGTEIGGNLVTRGTDEIAGGSVLTADTTVGGNVVSNGGEVLLETSDVAGNVNSNGSYYTDLYETWVDGTVTVRGNELGSINCAVVVQGRALFADNAGPVQLGSDGPETSCEGTSYWGANVTASGNTGGVTVDNNIVNGNVALNGNDPVATVGENNVVRGQVRGDFEESAPATAARRMAVAEAPQTRADALQKKFEERTGSAEAEAEKAGAAKL
ncbi:hypothetical protein DT076_07510 [Desertihabitans brevis]|uniref:Right-handed parallel beta-helix repeat-containing protein n=1 Tax=Desertihabitans brevis TaxID=2268447 RepID=A0A367YVH8_9ACTN|nr:hypothetical protein [Desertihabitans brevis]RCK69874.1 hypothetical protein DT076_07510 [Desertihabitans brevis]